MAPAAMASAAPPTSVLWITVDTLRTDRLSVYGYHRRTSPAIDDLVRKGARFSRARTVEPLTNPALSSMLTSLPPHLHGATRNGLRMRPDLVSVTTVLRDHGWSTAAFVGNWTLKDRLSRLGDHFESYHEVLTRRRWFGLINREANARDITDQSVRWLRQHRQSTPDTPFLLWVHYVEPHAPYRLHGRFAKRLGVGANPKKGDHYDSEIAFCDHEIGRLLAAVADDVDAGRLLVVFASDHGESLGEHGHWGHGRRLYEPTLSIPMAITWAGRIRPQTVDGPALITDLAPTVLELLGVAVPESFTGHSWSGVLVGNEAPPAARPACVQAHRGSVKGRHDSDRARSRGLVAVARIADEQKEILRMGAGTRLVFDLDEDPAELHSLAEPDSSPSRELLECVGEVLEGLQAADRVTSRKLDEEDREMLRQLGYLD
jgi:arylsulfatase A-like enzyme